MDKTDTKDVKRRIRTLIYHVGALQGSYPQVLQDPEYARAHLLALQKSLPQMRHILRFASEMIPLIEQVAGVAGEGSAQLGDVSKNLRHIDDAAESAVQQILSGLEQVEDDLRRAQDSMEAGQGSQEALDSASDKLMGLFSALQFQDITSQKIRATHALLAQLETSLNSLGEQLGMEFEDSEIDVQEGTYDPDASYAPESTDRIQQAVDAVVSTVREVADSSDAGPGEDDAQHGDEDSVAQGDIDRMIEENG